MATPSSLFLSQGDQIFVVTELQDAQGNKLDIDLVSVNWPRVVDLNDRALRRVVVGLGGRENGYPREKKEVTP